MAYIKEYWEDRQVQAERARKHTVQMEKEYAEEISVCQGNTITYDRKFWGRNNTEGKMKVCVLNMNTVKAAA